MKKNLITTVLSLTLSALLFSQESDSNKDQNKNEGFFNITKASYSSTTNSKFELFIPGEGNIFGDLDTDGAHAWSFHTINGIFISPSFSVGIGLGLENHDNPNFNILPLFLDVRAYLSDSVESFYSFLDVGPTIRLGGDNSDLRKGVIFNLGIGYKFTISDNLFLVSDVFYSHKTISLTDEGIGTSDDIVKVNGFGLSLGVIF